MEKYFMSSEFEVYDSAKLEERVGPDKYYIEIVLSVDDVREFSARTALLMEYVKTSGDPEHQDYLIYYLAKIANTENRNMNVRQFAVNTLAKIGHDNSSGFAAAILWTICTSDEPLRFRWAAVDALKVIDPEKADFMKRSNTAVELFDRTLDPDNPPPKLDLDEAMVRLAEKQKRQLNILPLISLFIFGILMGIFLFRNTVYFKFVIVGLIFIAAGFVIMMFILSRRCPKCKRFFARGPLQARGSFDSKISTPIGSLGTGGSNVHTRHRINVYQTSCKYCKHSWMVLR